MDARIIAYSLKRALVLSLPLMASSTFNFSSAQLRFNQADRQLESLQILESRLANPEVRDKLTPVQWVQYGARISEALSGNHDQIRQSAVRMVILYGPLLHLKKSAIFDLVRIYRGHENKMVRRMAAVALGQTHDAWAIDFLQRSFRHEREPSIRHTIAAIMAGERGKVAEPAIPVPAIAAGDR